MSRNKYAVFLRGVNVGGNVKISMTDLKKVLADNGFSNVQTYINSGNVIVESDSGRKPIQQQINSLIKGRFDLDIAMIIKSLSELTEIIHSDPYDREREITDSRKILMLLSDAIDPDKMATLKSEFPLKENYYLFNDVIYIYYHEGSGTSRFTVNLIERKFNITATARNWKTIVKMTGLMSDASLISSASA